MNMILLHFSPLHTIALGDILTYNNNNSKNTSVLPFAAGMHTKLLGCSTEGVLTGLEKLNNLAVDTQLH